MELEISDFVVIASGGQNALFGKVFATQLENIQAVRLIEAILFFSMISLHNDSLTRQYAMLATAYQLLEKVVKIDDCR